MPILHKSLPIVIKAEGDASSRRVTVTCSTGQVDRSGDIVVQAGIQLDNFRRTRTVLWNHDQDHPVAAATDIVVDGDKLKSEVDFPPAGISAKADEIYGLITCDPPVINAVSIGFLPITQEPVDAKNPRKGDKFLTSELLEFSFVSVPANPGAIVTQRNMGEDVVLKMTKKGLYTVAGLASLLGELGYLRDSAAYEAEREADESKVPGMLTDALKQLGDVLLAMTEEEVAELLAGKDGMFLAAQIGREKAVVGDKGPEVLTLRKDLTTEQRAELAEKWKALQSFGTVEVIERAGRTISSTNEGKMRDALKSVKDGHKAMKDCLDDMTTDGDKGMSEEQVKRLRRSRMVDLGE